MSVKIYDLVSDVHDAAAIDKSLAPFVSELEGALGDKFEAAESAAEIENEPMRLIFVKSGGVENLFKIQFGNSTGPFLLLTSAMHNSLPAAMEILSFIRSRGGRGEILHGAARDVAARLSAVIKAGAALRNFKDRRIGVIGKPSDWLIASDVDYAAAKEKFGFELIDIPMVELLAEYKKKHEVKSPRLAEIMKKGFDAEALEGALNLYESLKALRARYQLSAFTIRCFDLLGAVRNTGCLALALMNGEGVTAGCEGDIPALISMMIINELSGSQSFMANPSSIDAEKNTAIFAHCTLPLDMTRGYELDSHFESRLGVAIRGAVPGGAGTIFKISSELDEYWSSPIDILSNLNRENLCRTQIEVRVEKGVDYFLKRPFGNHHIIASGDHTALIDEFFNAVRNR